jgi:hypothetical protein
MATRRKSVGKKPKAKPVAGKSRARAVKSLLAKVEKKMAGDEIKATVGDYIRLVQLQKELDDEEPKEIKVTWVEPETKPETKG